MLVSRTRRCVVSTLYAVFVSSTLLAASSEGRSCVAVVRSASAFVGRRSVSGGFCGSAILQRCDSMVFNCVDIAEAIKSMFSRKKAMSPERISRSASVMWPFSWAVTSSITACSSGGRSIAFEGRSESVWIRICDSKRCVRAVIRFCKQLE